VKWYQHTIQFRQFHHKSPWQSVIVFCCWGSAKGLMLFVCPHHSLQHCGVNSWRLACTTVTCIRSNSLGWNIVIQEISASNFCSLAVLGLRGKVSAVISEIAKANWMKNAHRKLRNECWYADVDVDGKVEIFVSNVGVAKGGYREGGSNVRIWKFNLQWSQVRKRGKIGLNQLLIYI